MLDKSFRILVSNDDGAHAPGLHALVAAMQRLGATDVIAPDRNHSGASNSLTLRQPIRLRTLDNGYISVEGTPCDCVHIALTGLLPDKPNIVVSGINAGANMGDDVLYSGTLAAAMEGCLLGYSAIAFSLASSKGFQHFSQAADIAYQLTQHMLASPLPSPMLLNVNIPDIPIVQGFRITRLGRRSRHQGLYPAVDPRGHTVYWIGRPGDELDAGPDTDFHALQQGFVSITPLHMDLTDYQCFGDLAISLQHFHIG